MDKSGQRREAHDAAAVRELQQMLPGINREATHVGGTAQIRSCEKRELLVTRISPTS